MLRCGVCEPIASECVNIVLQGVGCGEQGTGGGVSTHLPLIGNPGAGGRPNLAIMLIKFIFV